MRVPWRTHTLGFSTTYITAIITVVITAITVDIVRATNSIMFRCVLKHVCRLPGAGLMRSLAAGNAKFSKS